MVLIAGGDGMKILVAFPTRSRPEKFLEALELWQSPLVETVVVIDRDDATMNNPEMLATIARAGAAVRIIEPAGKIAAMNAGFVGREFEIGIVAQDDLEPRRRYAEIILDAWARHFGDSTDGILHLDDGHQTSGLNTIVVIGRQYYDRFGYIYHPSYKSLWCDNEYTDISVHLNRVVRLAGRIITHEWAGNHPDALLKHNESFWDQDKANYLRRKALGFPLESVPA
jgi:hypothetical protein